MHSVDLFMSIYVSIVFDWRGKKNKGGNIIRFSRHYKGV